MGTREFETLRQEAQVTAVHVFRRLPPPPNAEFPELDDDQHESLAIHAADYLRAVLRVYPSSPVTLVAGLTRPQQTLLGARLRYTAADEDEDLLGRIDFANYEKVRCRYGRVRYGTPSQPSEPVSDAGVGGPSTPRRFVNLTAHEVVVRGSSGWEVAFPPSGELARRSEQPMQIGSVEADGHQVPVVHQELGELAGLPDPEPGVVYIVSRLAALAGPQRSDVVYPAGEIRDTKGRLVAVESLGVVNPAAFPQGNGE